MRERERERERQRGVKGAQSKPNPSPNAFPKLWDARVEKKGGGRARFPLKNLRNYCLRIMCGNYLLRIMSENYQLVYHDAEKLRFIGILAYPKSFLK